MSLPRIYHVAVPGFVHSRAFRCIWLLEELDVEDYEVCLLDPKQPYAPQMRQYGIRHCHKVPTLQLGEMELAESGVISQYLAETYQGLLGTDDERLDRMYWVAMAETSITFRIPLLPTLMDPDKSLDELKAQAVEPMRAVFQGNIARFEDHFATTGNEFLLSSGISIADTMCGWSLFMFHRWGIMDLSQDSSPLTLSYLDRLKNRPGFAHAEKIEHLSPGLYPRS